MKSLSPLFGVPVFLLAACLSVFAATPNVQYSSFCDTTATFTGKEAIYIPVSDSDAAPAKQVAALIASVAREAGLTITDSATAAQRILTFEIRPFSKIIRYDDADSVRSHEVIDTTYNSIQIHVFDIQRRIQGSLDPIWAGVLNAPDPLFNASLDQLLARLFTLYGKTDTKREVFQPLYRPPQSPEQLPDSAAGPKSLTPAGDSSSNLRDAAALQPD